jgi:hypothetical protein
LRVDSPGAAVLKYETSFLTFFCLATLQVTIRSAAASPIVRPDTPISRTRWNSTASSGSSAVHSPTVASMKIAGRSAHTQTIIQPGS